MDKKRDNDKPSTNDSQSSTNTMFNFEKLETWQDWTAEKQGKMLSGLRSSLLGKRD